MVSECEIQRQEKRYPFPYESDLPSIITKWHKKIEKAQGPISSLGEDSRPYGGPMPCQANLSGKLKKAEVKTSSVVTNKFPGARLYCHLKNGWPWACN